MALTRCPQCSEEITDKFAFCPHCGYALQGQPTSSTSAEPSRVEVPTTEGGSKPQESRSLSGIEETFRQVYLKEGTIPAIKYWRKVTGVSLSEAKAFYDQEKAAGRLGEAARREKRAGCFPLLMAVLVVVVLVVAYLVVNWLLIQNGFYPDRYHH